MNVTTTFCAGIVLALATASCATAGPPKELLSARAEYQRAEQSPAAKYDPADLYTARKAVNAAESSYKQYGDTQDTRDLAYIADRRAQIAQARGNASQSSAQQEQTVGDMHAAESQHAKSTSAQLSKANQTIELQDQAMKTQTAQLAASEKRAAQAAADLAKVASVKEDSRGMVITLSGGVLFASAKADLLPTAQLKLNSVADALTQQDPDSKMVVEGHTDSQGGDSYNMELSRRRAEAVRAYLVSRGIAADRVTSQGFGSSRSVADNKSAEGRANNRRVEIVVEPKASPRL